MPETERPLVCWPCEFARNHDAEQAEVNVNRLAETELTAKSNVRFVPKVELRRCVAKDCFVAESVSVNDSLNKNARMRENWKLEVRVNQCKRRPPLVWRSEVP
jgi:hypothetical protein